MSIPKSKFTRVEPNDCVGKTIKAIDYDKWDSCVVVFTDDTYFILAISGDSDDASLVALHDIFFSHPNTLCRLGFFTKEEMKAHREAELEKLREEQKQRDLETLARLKQQYEK